MTGRELSKLGKVLDNSAVHNLDGLGKAVHYLADIDKGVVSFSSGRRL